MQTPYEHSCWRVDTTLVPSSVTWGQCRKPEVDIATERTCPACAYERGYNEGRKCIILPPRVRPPLVLACGICGKEHSNG